VNRGDLHTDLRPTLAYPVTTKRLRPRLTWTGADGSHEEIVEGRVLLGSSPHVPIKIDDRAVSRLHAELEVRPTGVWVRDIGSRNGTFVDRVQIESALLADGASLRCGDTVLTLSYSRGATASVALWPTHHFEGLLGRSELMREVFYLLSRYAENDAPVLVQGETGTGKELVAKAIHLQSKRSEGPFVVVDCASLSEAMLDSELFGRMGGPSGSSDAREGAFEAAHDGTLFLDELGELPLAMQPKLLRVLESAGVRRPGESQQRPIDVRLIGATHRDLAAMVASGAFREDLYFRLSDLPVIVPPLRSRPDDIALLAEHFLGHTEPTLTNAQVERLGRHPWPGNVRELRAFAHRATTLGIETALAMLSGAAVDAIHSPQPRREAANEGAGLSIDPDVPYKDLREQWMDRLELAYLKAQLRRHGRNPVAIAEAADIDATYVRRLLKKHSL
jgi:transcriptional regulator with PAS, ATPase and Fis domain